MKRKEYFSLVMGLGMLIYFACIAPAQSVSVAPEVDRAPASTKQDSTYARLIDPVIGSWQPWLYS
jgi:hypothetical protein